MNLKEFE